MKAEGQNGHTSVESPPGLIPIPNREADNPSITRMHLCLACYPGEADGGVWWLSVRFRG